MFIIFDTETTGLPTSRCANPEKDFDKHWSHCRLVQIAWCVYAEDGDIIEESVHTIKPVGFTILPSNYHNITHDNATRIGADLEHTLLEFVDTIKRHPNSTLVAHNFKFDHDVIVAEMARLNLKPAIKMINGTKSHCTMLAATQPGQRYTSLNAAYKTVTGQDHVKAHDALEDVYACGIVFMASKYGKK
jgi:DNA polymerase III epsilon subunit-like protein